MDFLKLDYHFFKQLLSSSRYKIEGKTKLSIVFNMELKHINHKSENVVPKNLNSKIFLF